MHAVVCLLVSQVAALVLEMRSGQVQGPKRDWVPLVLDLVRRSDLRLADYWDPLSSPKGLWQLWCRWSRHSLVVEKNMGGW